MTVTTTNPVRALQDAARAKGDDYAAVTIAHRVTRTQAMVAFSRGEVLVVSERQAGPELKVGALTTTHHRDSTTWDELVAQVDMWSNRYPSQTFYVAVADVDADGDPWPLAYTVNNVRIVPGLRVRDYNSRETTVTDRKPSGGLSEPPWFTTANGGLFDGSRLTAL
jgi:hypothetical protein